MRIVHYCQHILGMGHFFRSLEIIKALSKHEVTLVTGGPPVDTALPEHVRHVTLPAVMTHKTTGAYVYGDGPLAGTPIPEDQLPLLKQQRASKLGATLADIRPDVFLVELFPFGRKWFSFELLPVLERIRSGEFGSVRVVCSLRDILVEKSDQAKFESRVLSVLNPLFHGVLVHTDPNVITLAETFSAIEDITIPVLNTGYVTPLPSTEKGGSSAENTKENAAGSEEQRPAATKAELGFSPDLPLIVASAGSGSVGDDLLLATVRASVELYSSTPHCLAVFTGPLMDEATVAMLNDMASDHGHIRISRFTDRFMDYLTAADLSVSMAGYNTSMNLLAAGTYGLVLPFDANREQRMRSERLASLGLMKVLTPEMIRAEHYLGAGDSAHSLPDQETRDTESPLCKAMRQGLREGLRQGLRKGLHEGVRQSSSQHSVDLQGARRSAELIELYFSPNDTGSSKKKGAPNQNVSSRNTMPEHSDTSSADAHTIALKADQKTPQSGDTHED